MSEYFWQGIGETNGRRPTNADLAGFWDMVMIQVCACNVYRRGGGLGFFLGGYVPPGTPNWHPVLEKISPKIDAPF